MKTTLNLNDIADQHIQDALRPDPGSPKFIFFDDPNQPTRKPEPRPFPTIYKDKRMKSAAYPWMQDTDFVIEEHVEDDPLTYKLAQYGYRTVIKNGVKKREEIELDPEPIPQSRAAAIRAHSRWLINWYARSSLQRGDLAQEWLVKAARPEIGDQWLETDDLTDDEREAYEHLKLRVSIIRFLRSALRKRNHLQFTHRQPTHTVFLNPDGTRHVTSGRSPIQGKMAFLQRHRPVNLDLIYQGHHIRGADEEAAIRNLARFTGVNQARQIVREALTQAYPRHPLDESQVMADKVIKEDGTSYYFIAKRIPSDQRPSSYYDEDPTFKEVPTKDGWETRYEWNGSTLMTVTSPFMPPGAYRLTVRDVENAILQGANLADDEQDRMAMDIAGVSFYDYRDQLASDGPTDDQRERGIDQKKLRPISSLSWDEAALYDRLRSFGLDEIAELVLEVPEEGSEDWIGTALLENGVDRDETLQEFEKYLLDADDRERIDWKATNEARKTNPRHPVILLPRSMWPEPVAEAIHKIIWGSRLTDDQVHAQNYTLPATLPDRIWTDPNTGLNHTMSWDGNHWRVNGRIVMP